VLQHGLRHFGALHLLGIIALQTRRTQAGVELIIKAIELNPYSAAAHSNLGMGLIDLKRFAEALASLDKAIALNPDFAEAHNNRGNALLGLKRPADALPSYDKAIALKPEFAEAHNNRGNALNDLKRHNEAVVSYDKAIALKADYAETYYNRGVALNALKRHEDALASYDKAIALKPDYAEAYNHRGAALHALKRHEQALASYDKAIALKPDYAEAYNDRGAALHALERHEQALASYDKAIALKPDYVEAYYNRGNALNELQRYEQALASYRKAIALKPDLAEAYNDLGNALSDLQRNEEALASLDKAIALKPEFAAAYNNRGNALNDLKRHNEAVVSYDKAIALKPHYRQAYYNRGNALNELKRHEQALASYDKAIALKPDFAEAHNNRGFALNELKRHEEALASYDRTIALKPDSASAYNNRGNALNELKRHEEALANCDKAIVLKPDYAEAYYNRGLALAALKRHEEAAGAYAEVLRIDPQHPFTKGLFLHQKMLSCDWNGVDELIAEIDRDVASGELSATPFGWQAVAKSQRSLQLCAELYNRNKFPADIRISTRQPPASYRKIRIGYLSGELREQATSHLVVGVLELHDNSRFEIYGIDNGWDDKSEIRRRINAAAHKIIDISRLSDSSAVAAICENHIDILVNLNGYFGVHRTRVFAQRPAPLQVNYLGFPGTLGASYIDYIIADQHVIPLDHREFYTEKVVYLPDCYQANDRRKQIATHPFDREECGLPRKGFVFCCFNNNYKITPGVFDCWMRILKQVAESVLWLLEDNAASAFNLRKEASARGVDPERLVFAKRISLPDHLARHRLADLFLDTLPCNAHTTASDALWAGLPLLTQIGETFTGRVAASLLTAIGLPELITSTPQAYEELAVELATNPGKLAAFKHKLANNRLTTPLFDTQLYTRHIEAAYATMYERYRAGLPPDHIYVQQ